MAQWRSELELHANFPRIHEYESADKNNTYLKLTDNDVVLATYTAVERESPTPSPKILKRLEAKADETNETIERVVDEWKRGKMKQSYFLHKIEWYRVSLDLKSLI